MSKVEKSPSSQFAPSKTLTSAALYSTTSNMDLIETN